MKIQPIAVQQYNFFKKPVMPAVPNSPNIQQNSSSSVNYPMMFTGYSNTSFIDDLKSLNDVHCPVCNTVMIGDDEINNLIKKASTIEKASDYIQFLEENEDNIFKPFRPLINHAKKLNEKNPDSTIEELFCKLKKGTKSYYKHSISNVINDLEEKKISHPFSANDNLLINNCIKELEEVNNDETLNFPSYQRCRDIIKENIMQMEDDKRFAICNVSTDKIFRAFNYVQCFKSEFDQTGNFVPLKETFTRNLFKQSGKQIYYIKQKNISEPNKFYRNILTCDLCTRRNPHNLIAHFQKYSQADANFKQYVSDINKASSNGKLSSNRVYINNLIDIVNKMSQGNIKLDKTAGLQK